MTWDSRKSAKTGLFRRVRPWFLLAILPVLAVAAAAWDHQLKNGPQRIPLPPECAWTLMAADFPVFWAQLAQTRAGAAWSEAFPMRLHEAELAVRLATGIRPTPGRWRVWLGPLLAVGYFDGTSGICVRPGLLLRSAERLARLLGAAVVDEGLTRYGGYSYAWRAGCLVASKSPEFVRAAIESPGLAPPVLPPDEIQLEWSGEQGGRVRLRAQEGLPVLGDIPGTLAAPQTSLTSVNTLPGSPILSVSAAKPSDIFRLTGLLWEAATPWCEEIAPKLMHPAAQLAQHLVHAWQWDRLGRSWDRSVAECTLALTGISRDSGLPIPVAAAVFRSKKEGATVHPFAPLLGEESALPYEWNGVPGRARPIWGREWTLCLATDTDAWYAASRESEMRRIMDAPGTPSKYESDLVLRIDWQRVSAEAAALLRDAADLELLPRMNARDAVPWIESWSRFLEALQVMTVEAWSNGGRIEFRGELAGERENRE